MLSYGPLIHYVFFHPRLNLEFFKILVTEHLHLADAIRTVPGSAHAVTDPLRIEQMDTY